MPFVPVRIVCMLSALLVIIGTGSNLAHAQQAVGSDATAIVQKSYSAMGCATVANDTTVEVHGNISLADGTVMPVTIDSQGNHRWRSELDTPKGHKTTIVNDGHGQMLDKSGNATPLAEANTFHQRPMHIPCLSNVGLAAVQATVLRSETIGKDTFDVIELLPADHPSFAPVIERMKTVAWISRTTGYLGRLQYINSSELNDSATQAVTIDYADYRVISGMSVPFDQITRSGDFSLEMKLDSVQLNTPAADFSLR